jgi:hypothetical protein
MRAWVIAALLLGVALMVAGCADEGDPAEAVENYLAARVEGDADGLRDLTCAARESEVEGLTISFANVDASLEGLSCSKRDDNTVTCAGNIVAVYNGENTEFPLGAYRVVKEDGEWKVCGEAEEVRDADED